MLEEPPHNTRLSSPANSTTSRPRSLHNFIFPSTLAWHQRISRIVSPINKDNKNGESNLNPSKSDQKPYESRSWNLRTRKANIIPNFKNSFSTSRPSPAVKTLSMEKGKRICGAYVGHVNYKKFEGERCKFSVALKKEEIEEDFFRITGVKPPRRPKKRPRSIQKRIDSVFPGCQVFEITPDLYKVNVELIIRTITISLFVSYVKHRE